MSEGSHDGDHEYADSPGWLAAQRRDPAFVTKYARRNPRTEDLAESALFVFAYLRP